MTEHIMEVVLQPVRRFFLWNLPKQVKIEIHERLSRFVCVYCCSPHYDGTDSNLLDASFTLKEEQCNIKRLHIKFTLIISSPDKIGDVEDDIRRQLDKIEANYNREFHFCLPDTPSPWNPPTIIPWGNAVLPEIST